MDPDLNSMNLNKQHWWRLPESATPASPASVDRASLETSRHGKRRKKNTGLDKIIIIIIHISPTVHQDPLFNTLFVQCDLPPCEEAPGRDSNPKTSRQGGTPNLICFKRSYVISNFRCLTLEWLTSLSFYIFSARTKKK